MTVSRETPWEGMKIENIPVDLILRCRYQPRRLFDPEKLQELADSITVAGLLQPIVLRLLPSGMYELIAGERRWRAVQIAGFDDIPANILLNVSEQKAAELSLVENVCRDDITPIEEASGFQRLSSEFGLSRIDIAKRTGCSASKVKNAIRLLELPSEILELIDIGKLSSTHGRTLLSAEAQALSINQIIEISTRCVTKQWSSRQLEAQLKSVNQKKTVYTVDTNVENLRRALSDHFCTGTTINFNRTSHSGQLVIDFKSLDILQGILKKADFDIDEFNK